eukprot:TRINITY_DN1950_c1_g5_i1.p2 TRINITY_DN1950_c1_g5~~TRINITY_DN1950_c1_g5_i1.p2  ORF type:complete len:253 (-),score=14.22 TRINITY_DN1950_c1_g5_i1:883-1641(-)
MLNQLEMQILQNQIIQNYYKFQGIIIIIRFKFYSYYYLCTIKIITVIMQGLVVQSKFVRRSGGVRSSRLRIVCGKGFGSVNNTSGQEVGLSKPVWQQNKKICPCQSGLDYEQCCSKYHDGEIEPTPEAVMRARYSAYCKTKVPYLLVTTHSKNPSQKGTWYQGKQSSTLEEDMRATCKKVAFHTLEIVEVENQGEEGYVKFRTQFKYVGQRGQRDETTKLQSMEEKSKFAQEDGRWKYLEAVESDYTAHTYD